MCWSTINTQMTFSSLNDISSFPLITAQSVSYLFPLLFSYPDGSNRLHIRCLIGYIFWSEGSIRRRYFSFFFLFCIDSSIVLPISTNPQWFRSPWNLPLSHEWVSERAIEWAQRSVRAKRAVRSKRTSERCERTSEQRSEWPITNVSISRGFVSLWMDRQEYGQQCVKDRLSGVCGRSPLKSLFAVTTPKSQAILRTLEWRIKSITCRLV